MVRRPLALALVALAAALTGTASAEAATDASGRTGQVRFVKRMTPDFDKYVTNTTTDRRAWLNKKLWRTEVFSPFFDGNTSWYGQGWVYNDLYSIYNGSTLASQHPEWILKSPAGSKLFIPWGCSGGTCPQYAGDITNPAYRASWIAGLKSTLAKGYRGAWIDDVNLELRVGNGNGDQVAPFSPSLGRTMTSADWRKAVADFTTEIRAAIPADKEILHNSIWYAGMGAGGVDNADVQREIASADYINVERGFNDGGLTGGNGEWSTRAVQHFIDTVHGKGKGVIIDAFDASAAGSEYSLANYFLISSGKDGVGESSQTPDNWWKGWDTDLGTASGNRYDWQSLQRRDFTGGMVLVNEPGAPTRTVQLPQAMTTVAGKSVTSVTLGAGQGAVLTGAGPSGNTDGGTTTPTVPAPPTVPVTPPATTPTTPPTGTPAPATPPVATTCTKVRVTYPTLRWDAKRGRFVQRTGSTTICIPASLAGKARKAAITKATKVARKASLRVAKAARLQSVTAGAARAAGAKA